jgi:putative acyl-CoA dehydrogenase
MADIKSYSKKKGKADEHTQALDAYIARLEDSLAGLRVADSATLQRSARNVVDRLAVAMQASILLRFGDAVVARAYIASRVADSGERGVSAGGGHVFSDGEIDHILERNLRGLPVD